MQRDARSALGENVLRLRRERDWTREQLAVRAGVASRTLASIEAGDANPTLSILLSLAETLQVSVSELTAEPTEIAS